MFPHVVCRYATNVQQDERNKCLKPGRPLWHWGAFVNSIIPTRFTKTMDSFDQSLYTLNIFEPTGAVHSPPRVFLPYFWSLRLVSSQAGSTATPKCLRSVGPMSIPFRWGRPVGSSITPKAIKSIQKSHGFWSHVDILYEIFWNIIILLKHIETLLFNITYMGLKSSILAASFPTTHPIRTSGIRPRCFGTMSWRGPQIPSTKLMSLRFRASKVILSLSQLVYNKSKYLLGFDWGDLLFSNWINHHLWTFFCYFQVS